MTQPPRMPEAKLTGRCLCGAVRFELDRPPLDANYCHCTRCQRRTGTGSSAQAQIAPGSLRITAGAGLVREWLPDEGFAKAFCSACGSALFSRDPAGEDWSSVRMAAFDEDPGVRPSHRQFTDFAAPWEPIPDDGLPRYPGSARGRR